MSTRTQRVTPLLDLSPRRLRERLSDGYPVDRLALRDRAYRGVSLGLPSLVERLTWKTFQKVFHFDPDRAVLRGWNVRLRQTGIDGPPEPKRRRGVPVTFGHYRVVDPGERLPKDVRRGLLIDYGLGSNRRTDPVRFLRDPIVALEEHDSTFLLGCSFVEIGRHTVATPSYFALIDEGPLTHVVPADAPG
ncbi:MAG: hypothetical protein AAGF12_19370 [Myxococcota bacterium]